MKFGSLGCLDCLIMNGFGLMGSKSVLAKVSIEI